NRDGKVRRDRKNVPHQRAAEVLPDCPVVGKRRQIPRHPEPADVNTWENRRTNYGEKRHRFCRTVDRSTPFLAEQEQDRRDQCARMSYTDPENEVGDPPCPADRDVVSPRANAGRNEISDAKKSKRGSARGNGKRHPPPPRRGLFYHAGNTLRQPVEIAPIQNQRNKRDSPLGLFSLFWCCCWRSVHDSNCELPIASCQLCQLKIENRKSKNHQVAFSSKLATPISLASGIFAFGLRIRAR